MLHKTSIALGALAITGSVHAALISVEMAGSGAASGSLASLGTVNMRLTLSFDDSASALASNTSFGAWSYIVTSTAGDTLFAATGNAATGTASTYSRWTSGSTSTRRYTVVLGGTTSSAWQGAAAGTGLPAITMVELGYVAARNGSTYGTMGESLTQSAGVGGGFLMAIANGTAGAFGAVGTTGSSFAFVPAPGAASLLALAGVVSVRRRRA